MDNGVPTPDQADEIDWTGQVLGEFRLLHRLGRGGMGQVYLAEQTSLKRKVALKLLHPELASNERSLLRFKAEAENVARATHANIVQIYTINQDRGIHYLALEYVEGRNLREFIEKKGPPELSLGLHIMTQVASALQRASELGIIHRDIKPENILLTKKGEVKVADFGLSRCFAEESAQSITQSQVTMGTPLYMSPEQVERKTVDTRTDIYSFGVTCYHMFAGTPPFKGNSPIEVAYQHVHKEPQPLAEVRPDLPAALCAIVAKMMAKKPEERYQTPREIVRDVNQVREAFNLGTVAAISISSSFIGTATDVSRAAPTQIAVTPAGRSWLWPIVMVVSVLAALAGGLGFGWVQHVRQQPKEQPPAQVTPPLDDGPKKPPVTKANEQEMKNQVEKYLDRTSLTEIATGLQHSSELGLYYLEERRFDDADQFFSKLKTPERKAYYRFLGRLGHAMTLAFKDDAAASNKEFVSVVADIERIESKLGPGFAFKVSKKDLPAFADEVEGYKHAWKLNTPMREMAAKALQHNFINDPANFPKDKLDAYRFPPRPMVKAAPTPAP